MPPAAAKRRPPSAPGWSRWMAKCWPSRPKPSPTARPSNINKPHPFVSRGGVKLAAALDHFAAVAGRPRLPGYRRLHRRLHRSAAGGRRGQGLCHRCRPWPDASAPQPRSGAWCARTASMPAIFPPAHVPEAPQAITADVSFIGLQLALPPALAWPRRAPGWWRWSSRNSRWAAPGSARAALCATPKRRREALADIKSFIGGQSRWTVIGHIESPIQGGEGNQRISDRGAESMTALPSISASAAAATLCRNSARRTDYRAPASAICVVANALARAPGLAMCMVDRAAASAAIIPAAAPCSRSRKWKAAIEVGFHAARSHAIVDMRECLVLTPALFDLAQTLRDALAPILNEGEKAEAACHRNR